MGAPHGHPFTRSFPGGGGPQGLQLFTPPPCPERQPILGVHVLTEEAWETGKAWAGSHSPSLAARCGRAQGVSSPGSPSCGRNPARLQHPGLPAAPPRPAPPTAVHPAGPCGSGGRGLLLGWPVEFFLTLCLLCSLPPPSPAPQSPAPTKPRPASQPPPRPLPCFCPPAGRGPMEHCAAPSCQSLGLAHRCPQPSQHPFPRWVSVAPIYRQENRGAGNRAFCPRSHSRPEADPGFELRPSGVFLLHNPHASSVSGKAMVKASLGRR